MANKKTNYNKMSENSVKDEAAVETVVDVVEGEVSEPEVIEPVYGFVTDCEKLNVRTNPKKNADIICTIDKNEKVEIIKGASTRDFYCVRSKKIKAANGFCMKKFITIK